MQNLSPQDLQVLTDRVNFLDLAIQKLQRLVNSHHQLVSIECIGIHEPDKKTLHTRFLFADGGVQIPGLRLQEFFQSHCSDLLVMRNSIIEVLDKGLQPFEEIAEYKSCFYCQGDTEQFNYFNLQVLQPGTESRTIKVKLIGKSTLICSGCHCLI